MHSWQKIATSHRGHKTHPRQTHVRNYPPTDHPPRSVSATHHPPPTPTNVPTTYSSTAVRQWSSTYNNVPGTRGADRRLCCMVRGESRFCTIFRHVTEGASLALTPNHPPHNHLTLTNDLHTAAVQLVQHVVEQDTWHWHASSTVGRHSEFPVGFAFILRFSATSRRER